MLAEEERRPRGLLRNVESEVRAQREKQKEEK
jgi:hypothetical protein